MELSPKEEKRIKEKLTMKKWVFLIIALSFLLCGCAGKNLGSSLYTIEVTGSPTNWLRFDGCYEVYTSQGELISKSVSGVVPASYLIMDAESISCVFQKKSEDGTLKVEIMNGDRVVAKSETSAAYGVVSLSI